MSIPTAVAERISRRIGPRLSPPAHAAADYLFAASFVTAGLLFWRKHRRAGLGALTCGAAKLALIAATDYPGLSGNARLVDFHTHGSLELALAGVVAALPELFSFDEHRHFFSVSAAGMTMLHNLTDFHRDDLRKPPRQFRAA